MGANYLSVVVLAGGRSRRLGRDKIWLPLDGRPLVERVVQRVLPLVGEIIFSTNNPGSFASLIATLSVPARVVVDEYPNGGPLAGIHAALKTANNELLLALAADMPLVNPDLLRQMVTLCAGYDAVVPKVPHPHSPDLAWEPLHAVYRHTCLQSIEEHLKAGDRQAFCFLPEVRTRALLAEEIASVDPHLASFFNVNTLEDWERLQTLKGS